MMTQAPLARTAPCAVAIVVTDDERELFLPDMRVTEGITEDMTRHDTLSFSRTGAWLRFLETRRPEVLVSAWLTPLVPESWLRGPDCPLRYICHLTGSVRTVVPRMFIERGGVVTNWGTMVGEQVAEHALLFALAALRDAPEWIGQRGRENASRFCIGKVNTRTLHRRRVGVHGCGNVAANLAALLRPFNCEIVCHSEGVPPAVVRAAGMIPAGTLNEIFKGKDVVFECEALTPGNEGCVGAEQLALMPDGAVFINVGRGRLVREDDLLREAACGRLTVALDVMTREPVPADSPWRDIPGAILSPHIAGPTRDVMPMIGGRAMQNLAGYIAGRPLENVVTLAQYDRAT